MIVDELVSEATNDLTPTVVVPNSSCKVCDIRITPREMDILLLVCEGRANKQIAHALKISEKTVKNHMQRIFSKLNVPSRNAAASMAFKLGIVKVQFMEHAA